jgi:hypothetical protein
MVWEIRSCALQRFRPCAMVLSLNTSGLGTLYLTNDNDRTFHLRTPSANTTLGSFSFNQVSTTSSHVRRYSLFSPWYRRSNLIPVQCASDFGSIPLAAIEYYSLKQRLTSPREHGPLGFSSRYLVTERSSRSVFRPQASSFSA